MAAVRAECDFNIDELWWFKYLDPSGRRSKSHNDVFIGNVTAVTESDVAWIWMDNNNEESRERAIAAQEGSRRPTSEELDCLPGAPLMGTLDYACSLGEIRECIKEAAGVEAEGGQGGRQNGYAHPRAPQLLGLH